MDYVFVVTQRTTNELVGVYVDTDSIPDRFIDADEQYSVKQVLVLGTEHSLAIVARGDLDPAMIRTLKD
jgi:hypothetical protein